MILPYFSMKKNGFNEEDNLKEILDDDMFCKD
jgi:hypothetical protein